ncbi:MAG: hypothetical protein ACREXX_16430 [Gammaproteobacteria bacterium]
MDCPACGRSDSTVVDTRKRGQLIRRRRRCTQCGRKFTTLEGPAGATLALSPDDKQVIRRAIDRIVAVLGIPPSK